MTDIALTTYPAHKSQNAGDSLITRSAIKLVQSRMSAFDPVVLFREKPLDGFTKRVRHRVLAPGFSVANGTYPTLFALFTDLGRMEYFWPVGCSFQAALPGPAAFETPYNKETLAFLLMIAERFGPFPCRDELIVQRLERFGIPAYYIGDLALFDDARIGTPPRMGQPVGSLVISLQHHIRYIEQIIDLAKRLARTYPHWRKCVSMQSIPNSMYRVLSVRMQELGYEVLEVFGDAERLEIYQDIDLHVGYRLHGHIHFLRNRKPSILLVEDARSYGFSRTPGTAFGCIDAWSEQAGEPDDGAPQRALDLLEAQLANGFADYARVFDFIDQTYADRVAPYFDKLAAELAR